MCIFCGGSCGGSGDQVLVALVAGVGLAIVKVRSVRSRRKDNGAAAGQDEETGTDPASEEQDERS